MQAGSRSALYQVAVRFFNRSLLLLIVLGLTQAANAQQAQPISSSVVLVLKLVSSTHVKPTTGIVVSNDGLVLVSAEFAAAEGEIIVLDGGADILSNGRPATIVNQAGPGGLAVLSVDGLKRPGITLSVTTLNAESALHLEAFPPAEYIAKGAQPLWMQVKVSPGNGSPISPETPLPYVSGAIIDDCGYLAGLSLTSGAQSLETDNAPITLFSSELTGILDSMQLALPRASCEHHIQEIKAPAGKQEEESAPINTPEPKEQKPEIVETEAVAPETHEDIVTEAPVDDSKGAVVDPGRAVATNASEPPSLWSSVPVWLPLLGIVILGVLIWKGLSFYQTATTQITPAAQPASDEPDTLPLETGPENAGTKPRSAPAGMTEIPELSERPDGCDGLVLVEGMLDADTRFKRFCFVNTEQVNIVIGRGEADIAIEHAAISRTHARIESDGELMTLSDLGSRNGTFIRGIPCLPGEVMFVEPEDDIFLGDVQFKISVVRQEAEWA